MKRKVKRPVSRMAVAFLSVFFACSVFGVTAFASQMLPTEKTVGPAVGVTSQNTESSVSSSIESVPSSTETSSVSSETSSNISTSEDTSENMSGNSSGDLSEGGSGDAPESTTSGQSTSGESSTSSDSSLPEDDPTEGGTSDPANGQTQSPSEEDPSQSASEPVYSWSPETGSKPSGTNTDPYAGVDPTISAPDNDDPSALSSQDWSELLSSGESAESSDSASSEEASSSVLGSLKSRGDSSWLLLVGIILIVVGVGGIGGFVYLQFIRPRRVHHNTLEDISQEDTQFVDMGDTGEIPTEFEDISSYSTGMPSDDSVTGEKETPKDVDDTIDISSQTEEKMDENPYGQARPVVKKAQAETTQVPPAPDGYTDISSHAETAVPTKPSIPKLNEHQAQKAAQAPGKAKDGKDSGDFDWDQFFNQK